MLDVNAPAPDFEAPDQSGDPVRLSELRGKLGGAVVVPQGLDRRLNQGGQGVP